MAGYRPFSLQFTICPLTLSFISATDDAYPSEEVLTSLWREVQSGIHDPPLTCVNNSTFLTTV